MIEAFAASAVALVWLIMIYIIVIAVDLHFSDKRKK